jgi:hypothetical protein
MWVHRQRRVVSWSPRGSGTTTTLLASPRYAYSSSPLQGLSYSCTYGLIWFHLCLFIFRKIYKPLDLLVFQLLVKVGSFVAWPVLYVREDCDCGWIFEIVGTRGGRSVFTAGVTAYLRMQKIWGTSLQCKRYQKPRFCVVRSSDPSIRIRSRSFSSDPSQGPKPSVHFLLDPVLGPKPFILFGSATGLEAVRSFSLVPHQSQSRPSFSLGSATGSGAVSQSGPRIEIW